MEEEGVEKNVKLEDEREKHEDIKEIDNKCGSRKKKGADGER